MVAKRILITGGSGFIGRRLVHALAARKDLVTVLSRDPVGAAQRLPAHVRVAGYTPTKAGPWFDELGQADAIVHLAGESIGGVRWTPARKKQFEASRITSTEMIITALEAINEHRRPEVLVGASAVGYYGSRDPEDEVDESAPPGKGYLADLTQRWEKAQRKVVELGVRSVQARFGIVLGPGGGALAKMVLPFRLHAGGPVGSGKQIVPWVHRDDVCGLIMFAIDHDEVNGPINVTSPHPVPMNDFARGIGLVMHRRSYLRVPEGALRAMFGEGADPMVSGQRALPRAAERMGYEFRFPDLVPALEDVLGPH